MTDFNKLVEQMAEMELTHKVMVYKASNGRYYFTIDIEPDNLATLLEFGAEILFEMEATGRDGTIDRLLEDVDKKAREMGINLPIKKSKSRA